MTRSAPPTAAAGTAGTGTAGTGIAGRPCLLGRYGAASGIEIELGSEPVTVGSGASSSVRLDAEGVAPRHAVIRPDEENGGYVLERLAPGILEVDGDPVVERAVLDELHVVRVGVEVDLFFRGLARAVVEPALRQRRSASATEPSALEATQAGVAELVVPSLLQSSEAVADHTMVDGLPAPAKLPVLPELPLPATRWQLVLVEGGAEFDLEEGEQLIGRSPKAGIHIEHQHVSRRHAILRLHEDKVTLRDLGSANFTTVDGERVVDEIEVPPGSVIAFGDCQAALVRNEVPGAGSGPSESREG